MTDATAQNVRQSAWRRLAPVAALLVILGAGYWLRTQRLSEIAYWFDESFCVKMAEFPVAEIWERAGHDTHPPLYFWTLKAWMSVFGSKPATLRMMSALWGLVAISGVYLFVREAYGAGPTGSGGRNDTATVPALASAALVALSPLQISWCVQVRMYAFGTALAAVSSWLLMRALRRGGRASWITYTLTALALAYTHHFGLLTLLAQYLFAVAALWRGWYSRGDGPRLARTIPAVLSGVFVLLVWQAWLPAIVDQKQRVVGDFWPKPLDWEQLGRTLYQLFGIHFWAAANWKIGLVIGQLIFAGLVLLQLGRRPADRFVALAAGLPIIAAAIASWQLRNIFVTRYLIFAHLFVLVAGVMLLSRLPGRWLRAVAYLCAIGGMGFQCRGHYLHREKMASHPGMQAAVARLDELRQEDEPVVVCNPMLYTSWVAYSSRRDRSYVYGTNDDYPFYHGTAVMREDEYLSADAVERESGDWLWTVGADRWMGKSWNAHLPDDWKEISNVHVSEYYCDLVLRLYRRDRRNDTGAGRAPPIVTQIDNSDPVEAATACADE